MLNELLTLASCHAEFFECHGLETVIAVSKLKQHQAHFYIADIFAQLCVNDAIDDNPNIPFLVNSGVVEAVFSFCRDTDDDLKYSGVALLLNLVNISSILI